MGNDKRIDYNTLEKATGGDSDAIKMILQHYSGYLYALSTVCCCDQYGSIFFLHDSDILEDLKIKTITSILQFQLR